MLADRPGRRAGNDKVVLDAEFSGRKRTAHHLEGPFDTKPSCRGGDLAPQPIGKGAEEILDMVSG